MLSNGRLAHEYNSLRRFPTMATEPEDDEDLSLVRASATLLEDLESSLPKILWKPAGPTLRTKRVHQYVKARDLDKIIALVGEETSAMR